jgi:hypothetical protein
MRFGVRSDADLCRKLYAPAVIVAYEMAHGQLEALGNVICTELKGFAANNAAMFGGRVLAPVEVQVDFGGPRPRLWKVDPHDEHALQRLSLQVAQRLVADAVSADISAAPTFELLVQGSRQPLTDVRQLLGHNERPQLFVNGRGAPLQASLPPISAAVSPFARRGERPASSVELSLTARDTALAKLRELLCTEIAASLSAHRGYLEPLQSDTLYGLASQLCSTPSQLLSMTAGKLVRPIRHMPPDASAEQLAAVFSSHKVWKQLAAELDVTAALPQQFLAAPLVAVAPPLPMLGADLSGVPNAYTSSVDQNRRMSAATMRIGALPSMLGAKVDGQYSKAKRADSATTAPFHHGATTHKPGKPGALSKPPKHAHMHTATQAGIDWAAGLHTVAAPLSDTSAPSHGAAPIMSDVEHTGLPLVLRSTPARFELGRHADADDDDDFAEDDDDGEDDTVDAPIAAPAAAAPAPQMALELMGSLGGPLVKTEALLAAGTPATSALVQATPAAAAAAATTTTNLIQAQPKPAKEHPPCVRVVNMSSAAELTLLVNTKADGSIARGHSRMVTLTKGVALTIGVKGRPGDTHTFEGGHHTMVLTDGKFALFDDTEVIKGKQYAEIKQTARVRFINTAGSGAALELFHNGQATVVEANGQLRTLPARTYLGRVGTVEKTVRLNQGNTYTVLFAPGLLVVLLDSRHGHLKARLVSRFFSALLIEGQMPAGQGVLFAPINEALPDAQAGAVPLQRYLCDDASALTQVGTCTLTSRGGTTYRLNEQRTEVTLADGSVRPVLGGWKQGDLAVFAIDASV